jgi:hypothetical protein
MNSVWKCNFSPSSTLKKWKLLSFLSCLHTHHSQVWLDQSSYSNYSLPPSSSFYSKINVCRYITIIHITCFFRTRQYFTAINLSFSNTYGTFFSSSRSTSIPWWPYSLSCQRLLLVNISLTIHVVSVKESSPTLLENSLHSNNCIVYSVSIGTKCYFYWRTTITLLLNFVSI